MFLLGGIHVKRRYLTKSDFKLGLQCPTKLYYSDKSEYAGQTFDDPFLQSLADGGYKVEELARAYYPDGYYVKTLDEEKALQKTAELLKQENCTIFDAAITYKNLFVRVDLLIKKGNKIRLIEVKSKSTDARSYEDFLSKSNKNILSGWKSYIYDITFQYFVATQALPAFHITPYLMFVNKDAQAPSDDLSQKIKVRVNEAGRRYAYLKEALTEEECTQRLLIEINTKELSKRVIHKDIISIVGKEFTFPQYVFFLADHYEQDLRIDVGINLACKDCEFKVSENKLLSGLKSGYHECFQRYLNWTEEDFKEDTIFDLRGYLQREELIEKNKIKFSQLTANDIGVTDHIEYIDDLSPLQPKQRQWLQLHKAQTKDNTPLIKKEALKREMGCWTYPYHFIDFETIQPRIPLFKGHKPNTYIAFQFSHHVVNEDGTIEHRSEYINIDQGVNPNIDFVRHLKKELDGDHGTIFRYSHHENTVLNKIYEQLDQETEENIEGREKLKQFILSITQTGGKNGRKGSRNMVDLCELVGNYYYDPYMQGSTSLKYVLPAVMNRSKYIQNKYSKPIYGAKNGIKSLNFEDKVWVKFEKGKVKDPYRLLPKLFKDLSNDEYELLRSFEDINNGGAAMTAYERLQSEEIPLSLRKEIKEGMLKYCELDTFAMVLIYEAWKDMVYV